MAPRSVVARKSDGNPEGKGVNGLLLDWYRTEPKGIVAKPGKRVLAELFTSMLVLSASFKYRPSPGVPNYLYWYQEQWSLSLIGPDEWTDERRACFAGACILHGDMTWTIEPSDLLGEENAMSRAVRSFFAGFAEMFDTDATLEELLPNYAERLPYYQRIYASGLSRSLRGSVHLAGRAAIPGRQWSRELPRDDHDLLTRAGY